MAIKKKFIHFKKKESFQRELDAGNILNTSIVFIADAKQIYLNGTYFSENTLFNLSELLDNISGELKETDTVNEAVIKLYKMLSNDTDIIKVLVQEINDLETNITERLDTTDEVVAAALTNLNQTLEGLNTLPVANFNTLGGIKSSIEHYDTQYSTVVNCVDVDSDGIANIIVTNPDYVITQSTEVVESNPIRVKLQAINSYPYYGLNAKVELNISDVGTGVPKKNALNLVTEKELRNFIRKKGFDIKHTGSYNTEKVGYPISVNYTYGATSDNLQYSVHGQYYDGSRSLTDSVNIVQEKGLKKVLESYPKLINGLIPTQYLPSYVDDVLEFESLSAFPTTGETGKIYVDTTENRTYRWSGTQYTEIGKSLSLGETSSTAYAGDKGAANAAKVINLEENLNKAISDIAIYPFDGFTNSFDNETSRPNGTILWGPSGFKIKVNGEWTDNQSDLPNYIKPGLGGGNVRNDRLFRYNNLLYRFDALGNIGNTLIPIVPLATDETHGIIKVNGVTDNINKSIYTNSDGEIGISIGNSNIKGISRAAAEELGYGNISFDTDSTSLTPDVNIYVYDGTRNLVSTSNNLIAEKGLVKVLEPYVKTDENGKINSNVIPFDGDFYYGEQNNSIVSGTPVQTKVKTVTNGLTGIDELVAETKGYYFDGSREPNINATNLVQEKGLHAVLANKVTVVEGKDLSSNDYTDADKTKLTGLREYTLATNSDIDAIING